MAMQVTDWEWYDKKVAENPSNPTWTCTQAYNPNFGKPVNRVGFYMDEFLAINLSNIPNYLQNAWDVVGIVSGHGKVRIGKSSIAQQIGLYMAWLVAGGRMKKREDWLSGEDNKYIVVKGPRRKVRFTLEENIVFSPEQLMNKASDLYKKYGKHQVIVYDEGRAGLDSAKAMSAINKAMQDFFQECGMYGHIIIIVLPSFFKLHEDYATARSLFLIDVYANKELRRGFFNFYNEQQKEYLYLQGKKMVGTIGKYKAGYHSFSGRFTKFLPFDKDLYENEKMKALGSKTMNKRDAKFIAQRNHIWWTIDRMNGMNKEEFCAHWNSIFNDNLSPSSLQDVIKSEDEKLQKDLGLSNYRKVLRNLERLKQLKTRDNIRKKIKENPDLELELF